MRPYPYGEPASRVCLLHLGHVDLIPTTPYWNYYCYKAHSGDVIDLVNVEDNSWKSGISILHFLLRSGRAYSISASIGIYNLMYASASTMSASVPFVVALCKFFPYRFVEAVESQGDSCKWIYSETLYTLVYKLYYIRWEGRMGGGWRINCGKNQYSLPEQKVVRAWGNGNGQIAVTHIDLKIVWELRGGMGPHNLHSYDAIGRVADRRCGLGRNETMIQCRLCFAAFH